MKKLLLISASTALISTTIFANNVGCGLGNSVIKNQDSVLMQVLAVTTNGTSGNQTFGITSGTSGCTKPSKIVSNDKATKFVENNMDALAMDISNGQGESIDTLATLLKVQDKSAFTAKLQNNFANIYTSSDVTSAQVVDNIITVAS
ncbi:hypothetical protein MNB_SV-12-1997 [hydrothermal vent metagenome]|uniref:DUF3015 domain-containing protein n=1 Tax=hydrothermal vent metagenome TaxID=652676 RepID=A0A1W1C952_9ZZZZ